MLIDDAVGWVVNKKLFPRYCERLFSTFLELLRKQRHTRPLAFDHILTYPPILLEFFIRRYFLFRNSWSLAFASATRSASTVPTAALMEGARSKFTARSLSDFWLS